MIRIKKVGRIFPRSKFEFFRANPVEWEKLKNGEIIEVPDNLYEQLDGVVNAEDESDKPSEQILETDVEEVNEDG